MSYHLNIRRSLGSGPLCGSGSTTTTTLSRVTCLRCLRLLENARTGAKPPPPKKYPPSPVLLGAHIQAMCGAQVTNTDHDSSTCAVCIARYDFALEQGVARRIARGWRLIDGRYVRLRRNGRNRNRTKGRAVIGFDIRAFNTKVRARAADGADISTVAP